MTIDTIAKLAKWQIAAFCAPMRHTVIAVRIVTCAPQLFSDLCAFSPSCEAS